MIYVSFLYKMKHIIKLFNSRLLKWHKKENQRELAWKGEKNPYFIWLSEIIMQQTRSEQGAPYYLKFKEKYPTIVDLANAPLDDILKTWQGLGYYSRARNLHKAAHQIINEYGGKFPKEYHNLIKIAGIGDYTASAIGSFAFNQHLAVLDGNVIRVLSRFFGIETAFDSTAGKKEFKALADKALMKSKSSDYNQAIMDFGATICTPKKPQCENCPMSSDCFSFTKDVVHLLPYKSKKLILKNRYFHYFLIERNHQILLKQRIEKDIWQDLWELPMIEQTKKNVSACLKELGLSQKSVITQKYESSQVLSHQKIHAIFIEIKENSALNIDGKWVDSKKLQNYAVPKIIFHFFKEKDYI
jgi:A/G-specific adenine glycosylase